MKIADKADFATMLAEIWELKSKEISKTTINAWWKWLQKYELIEIKNAFEKFIFNPDHGQYMPQISDIVKFIHQSSNATAGQTDKAWKQICQARIYLGAVTVAFDDPVIHLAIYDLGGWVYLCDLSDDKIDYMRHHFHERYIFHLRHGYPKWPKFLAGRHELGMKKNNEIRLVGDYAKARIVIEDGIERMDLKNPSSLRLISNEENK